jgi:hypothetical protein
MQEMETLGKEGINIVDGFTRQPFNLRAIIFVTIHDYQALFVFLEQVKDRTGSWSAWTKPYHLSWKVLER